MQKKEEEKYTDSEMPFDLSILLNKNKLFATIEKQANLNLNFKRENTNKLEYLPGQDQMCVNSLTCELNVAEKNKNEMLQISLLGSLSNHKELNESNKIKFLIERWELCKKNNLQTLLNTIVKQLIELAAMNIFTRIGIAYYFSDQEDIKSTWNSVFEILRVNSIFLNEINVKEDSVFKYHDELNYISQIKRQKFKISFQNYLLLGISNDTSLLPEVHHFSRVSEEFFQFNLISLSNRNILKASSGDNHFILLTAICSCQLKEECKCPQKSSCEVYLFGANNYGQLDGIGKSKNIKEHVWSLSLKTKIAHICGKGNRTIAVSIQGEIFEWGYPHKEIKKTGELDGIIKIDITSTLNIFLTNDKEVYVQGFLESDEQAFDIKVKFPIRIKSLFEMYGIKFEKISCGLTHVLLLTSNNNVFSFGNGKFGQLGLGKSLPYTYEPVKLPEFLDDKEKVIELISGNFFSLCLTSYGILYEWGLLKSDLNKIDKIEWIPKIHYLNEEMNFIKLGGEKHFVYGVTEEGLLYSWDLKFQITFRNTKIKVENVKTICCTMEAAIFIQGIIDPKFCTLIIEDKILKKNTPCKLKLNIRDNDGLLSLSDINSCDCFFILTIEENKLEYNKIEEVKKGTIVTIINDKNGNLIKLMDFTNKSYYLNPQTFSNFSEISLNVEKGIVNIQLICKNVGKYFLHTIIGDKYISNSPKQIEVRDEDPKNVIFQDKKLIPQEDEEKTLPQPINTKQIEKAKKEEFRMLLQKKKIENEELTKKRAKDAFEKMQLEKKKKVQELNENRRTRKEIITGGGFDLSKLSRIKTTFLKPFTK